VRRDGDSDRGSRGDASALDGHHAVRRYGDGAGKFGVFAIFRRFELWEPCSSYDLTTSLHIPTEAPCPTRPLRRSELH
jgi:hypothetical protein